MTPAIRYSLRQLRRSPAFTGAAVLSLALGIGANTAMFSLLDALVLRPLPVRDPSGLVRIANVDARGNPGPLPSRLVEQLRREQIFDGMCGFVTPLATVEIEGRFAPTSVHAMTGDCFPTLGLRPAIGRFFTESEDRAGMPDVVVLSYDAWQQEFGGSPAALGKQIQISNAKYTIIGVTQRGFRGLLLGFPPRLFYPIAEDSFTQNGVYWSDLFARLRSGETMQSVEARLRVLWPHLLESAIPASYHGLPRELFLGGKPQVTSAASGLDFVLRPKFTRPLIALVVIAALVLLVSCVNVANLLLARGVQQQREAAVRVALGAARWTLLRDAISEDLLLLAAGAGAGIGLAYAGERLLLALFSVSYSSFFIDTTPDIRVLGFTCVAAAVAFVVFSAIPAWKSSKVDAAAAIKTTSTRVAGSRSRARKAFIVAQVALTLALVAGASLFVSTLGQLRETRLGYDPGRLLNARLMPLPGGYGNNFSPVPYYHALLDRVRALPGVESAALSASVPLFTVPSYDIVSVDGSAERIRTAKERVDDRFFNTMGIPVVAGRPFTDSAVTNSVRTAIVSESLARRLFGRSDPIGRRITIGPNDKKPFEIVGIARDAVLSDPRSGNTAIVYTDYWQGLLIEQEWPNMIVRTRGNPVQVIDGLRRVLREGGREYVVRPRPMLQDRDASLAQERLLASLSTAFGALGLILATVGLFGLLSFSVAARTGEIGVRMALGADRKRVLRMVQREALMLVAIGVAVGLPITWIGGRAVSTLLYGIRPWDPVSMLFSIALLAVIGVAASWIPARRAASLDPMEALRHE